MTTDIFIKSYAADFEWLSFCLRSIQRFATGFRNVIVVVPEGDNPPTGTAEKVFRVREHGAPYLFQQSIKLHADHFTDAEFILYQDSDTIFTRPISPELVIADNRRPHWLYTPYSSLGNDESQTWKEVTSKAIREPVELEMMRRHPFVVARTALQEMRAWWQRSHGITLEQYILSQPAHEFSEFNALGCWQWLHRRSGVEWINTDEHMGTTYVHQSYSYGGINSAIRANLEAALA